MSFYSYISKVRGRRAPICFPNVATASEWPDSKSQLNGKQFKILASSSTVPTRPRHPRAFWPAPAPQPVPAWARCGECPSPSRVLRLPKVLHRHALGEHLVHCCPHRTRCTGRLAISARLRELGSPTVAVAEQVVVSHRDPAYSCEIGKSVRRDDGYRS
jgi:hypothetical protein